MNLYFCFWLGSRDFNEISSMSLTKIEINKKIFIVLFGTLVYDDGCATCSEPSVPLNRAKFGQTIFVKLFSPVFYRHSNTYTSLALFSFFPCSFLV